MRRGIDIVQSKTVFYHPDSQNIRKEVNRYKWREDAKGNGLDEPVKLWDHAMDAIRYGISYGEEEIQILCGGEGVEDAMPLALLVGAGDEEDEEMEWGVWE